MADTTVTLNSGTGGSDLSVDAAAGGELVQYVKLKFGASGTQTTVGSISSNPFPVALSATDNAVLDTIDADTGAIKLAVEIMDDWDESDRAKVNPIVGQAGIAAGTGVDGVTVPRVTLATNVALPAGTNAIGKLAANNGVDIGDVDVTSISAGANLVGDVGISGARTSGGTSIFRSIDLDEGALEVVKASAGQIYWMHVMNLAATVQYVKIYNAASGTIGTGTPVLTFPIPTQATTNGAGFTLSVPNGIAFATGISIGASTGIADADTGAPGTNTVVVNLGFA